MNKEEILHELIEVRAKRLKADNRIIELEALYDKAEPAKPELRHGDYGLNTANLPYIVINDKVQWLSHAKNVSTWLPSNPIFTDTYLGHNLVDDLAAMAEDLDEFEIESGDGWKLRIDGRSKGISFAVIKPEGDIRLINIKSEAVHKEIHHKLGAVIAFAKRKAKE